jgi:hypothetical protein
MDRRFKLALVIASVLLAGAVGVIAYNAGVSHGLAMAGNTGVPPVGPFPPYYWYRPWGFGFFGPFLFVFFSFFLLRVLFWRGLHGRRWMYAGSHDVPPPFDEWHRRAHERMNDQPPAKPQSGT